MAMASHIDVLERRTLLSVSLISVDTAGGFADGLSSGSALSFDGRYIAFTSRAADLVPDDGDQASDVFLRDRQSGSTTLVSVDAGDLPASVEAISGDGRLVVYSSGRLDADEVLVSDIFVRDVAAGTTSLVSAGLGGAPANGTSEQAQISRDGRFVAFRSSASNLVAGDTNGQPDIFLRDLDDETTTFVSVASDGGPAEGGSAFPVISADGRFVAFDSVSGDFGAPDDDLRTDVYVRDVATGQTTLVSVEPNGPDERDDVAGISADGRFVAFIRNSFDFESGQSAATVAQVYMRDRLEQSTTLVSVNASGIGGSNADSGINRNRNPNMISADGRFVVFRSFATDLTADGSRSQIYVRDLQGQPALARSPPRSRSQRRSSIF